LQIKEISCKNVGLIDTLQMTKKYRPIYYDTETTGVKSGSDRIIELAAYDPERDLSFCSFINPGCPIPAESTAICHITDDMVKDALPFKEVAPAFIEFCSGDTILIAHNNDAFDKPFLEAEFGRASLPFPAWKFLDSLKWSRKYRSDLPRHGLQVLREVYGIQSNQAHRALDDVMVLHQVFSRMIGDLPLHTVAELLSHTSVIVRMPFGKHAGKPLADVPKDYVRWLGDNGALDSKENAPLKAEFVKLGMIT
jgi:DNA polymerase-3 subunit epsilon